MFNTLFPHNLSPFAKLIISNPIEDLLESETFLELFSSPPFRAIVKFKWHTFARRRFYGVIFIYLAYFGLFAAATSNMAGHRQLMIASMSFGAIIILNGLRYTIILLVNSETQYLEPVVAIVLLTFPFITGFVEIVILERDENVTLLSILRSISIVLLWSGLIASLCIYQKIGVFVLGKNGSKKKITKGMTR